MYNSALMLSKKYFLICGTVDIKFAVFPTISTRDLPEQFTGPVPELLVKNCTDVLP